jgi:hypothetical protein
MRPRVLLPALFSCVLPCLALAQVDARVAALSRQLATDKDPAIRSKAAQGLGTSDDPEAVRALCAGLEDPEEAVRVAAAEGLGELQEVSALTCLQARRGGSDAVTAAAIREAVRSIEAFKAQKPSIYLAFDGVKDRTGSLSPELVRFAEQRFARKLVQRGAQLAPKGEKKAAAQSALQKRGIPGYRLIAEVHPAEGGGLRLTVVCLSYPDNRLLGQAEVQASRGEPAALLKALVPAAVEEAAGTLEWDS